MTVLDVDRDQSLSEAPALKVQIVDIKQALAKRNPGASSGAIDATGRLMASMGAAVVALPQERRQLLLEHPSEVKAMLQRAFAQLQDRLAKSEAPVEDDRPLRLRPAHVETAQGSGLGARISREEGLRRLEAYAQALTFEDWAGEVAGPGELERDEGVSRSTLNDWRRSGAVIGLLRGTRKHVYPRAQFVDGRPVPGLAQTQKIVGDARNAWLWLVTSDDPQAATPLARLKRGELEPVLNAAREAFG